MRARHKNITRVARSIVKKASRLGRIYVARLRPARRIGASVNGTNDSELKVLRRVLSAKLPPSQKGASLTRKLAIHGYACWE